MLKWQKGARVLRPRYGRRDLLAFVLLGGATVLGAAPAYAGRIVVAIDGLRDDKGSVMVALFNGPKDFPDGNAALRHVTLRASTRPITVAFDQLPPGAYAVGAYHDENGNGHMDTNFIGYPEEGYALSNGVRAGISRPRFSQASFQVGNDTTTVALRIVY